jgi:hypothetical protein
MLGGAFVTNVGTSSLVVYARRFAPPNGPVSIAFLGPRSTARFAVPRDSVALPWHLTAGASSAWEICPAPTG